jgi:hypothetical protein
MAVVDEENDRRTLSITRRLRIATSRKPDSAAGMPSEWGLAAQTGNVTAPILE